MKLRAHSRLFNFVLVAVIVSMPLSAQQKKALTAGQIFQNAEPRILNTLPNVTRWLDDSQYLEMKRPENGGKPQMMSVDAKTGKATEYKGLEEYNALLPEGINAGNPSSATEDNTKLIYEKDNDLYFLNTKTKEFKRLTQTTGEEKNPTISPDGKYVAFTRDNNLYAVDLQSGKEFQYTGDATEVVYSGYAAWVYYEEILGRASRYKAFWWSPDGSRLAFFRFDETKVPMFPIFGSPGQHGYLEKTRYPKSGDPNPEVRVGVVDVGSGKTTWADFNEKEDQYFGTPFWTPDSKQLFVQWMNRGQDRLIVYAVDPVTGKKKEAYSEHQDSWVDWLEEIEFLNKNEGFIIKTDRSGWMHLYRYGMDGKLKKQLTDGKWSVTGITSVDRDDDVVYFTARKETSTRIDFYKVGFDGKGLARLSFGDYSHRVSLSPKGSYFVTTYSNAATPARMALYTGRGKLVRELGDSKGKEYDSYDVAKTEMFTIPTSDGYNLPARWTLPTNFDPKKKYPILFSIYGGPGAGTVYDTYGGLGSQWLAQEGMIQISVDHRASGQFGKEGVALMYRDLGKWEMHDYIEAVKWLRTKPFVDAGKVCITGGSYGGYMTCMALTYAADYFTHGVAQSSVTSWELYDTHYTERYMDTPAENPEGYKAGSVLTYANQYKGILRIVHGDMDDNVHMQNSIQLIDTLETLGKHFEFMIYPGGRHGWGGAHAVHSRMESMRFFYQYLLEKPFPEETFKEAMAMPRGRR